VEKTKKTKFTILAEATWGLIQLEAFFPKLLIKTWLPHHTCQNGISSRIGSAFWRLRQQG